MRKTKSTTTPEIEADLKKISNYFWFNAILVTGFLIGALVLVIVFGPTGIGRKLLVSLLYLAIYFGLMYRNWEMRSMDNTWISSGGNTKPPPQKSPNVHAAATRPVIPSQVNGEPPIDGKKKTPS